MTRKKRSTKKAAPGKSDGADSEGSAATDGGEGKAPRPAKKSAARSGSTSKKGRASKKKGRKTSSAKDTPKGGTRRSKSDPEGGKSRSSKKKSGGESPPAPDREIPTEDLDAILDDLDGPEDVQALIAATVASAEPEGREEEIPVESLDDVPEVLDIEADQVEPVHYAEATDAAVEAEPAPDEDHVPADSSADAPAEPSPSSEEDLAGTIDLGPATTPEVRDWLLAEALAHAEMQDARYRVPFSDARRGGRWKAAVAAALFLTAAVLAISPPGWVRPDPPAVIDAPARARNVRRALLLQAQQVEAYRVRRQTLPSSLQELSGQLAGVRFVRSGNRAFQLIGHGPDGDAIVYDSSNPAPEFGRLATSWTQGASQ